MEEENNLELDSLCRSMKNTIDQTNMKSTLDFENSFSANNMNYSTILRENSYTGSSLKKMKIRDKKYSNTETVDSIYSTRNTTSISEDTKPYSFNIKENLFIKSKLMIKLDHELGDIYKLMVEIKNKKVEECLDSLENNVLSSLESFIGKIDALFSLYLFKIKYNCTKPEFSIKKEENGEREWKINIRNYFNEKIEIEINRSVIFKGTFNTFRTIGQLSVLAQIGSYVPSDKVIIPLFNNIFTYIQIEENLSTSYFLSSVQRMSTILKYSDINSLILLDSFGYGTNNEEGMQIFISVHSNIIYPTVISQSQFINSFNRDCSHKKLNRYLICYETVKNNTKIFSENEYNEIDVFRDDLIKNNFSLSFIEKLIECHNETTKENKNS